VLNVILNSTHPDHLFYNRTLYSQSSDINFTISASVPKGNISEFKLITNDVNRSITPTVNASLQGEPISTNNDYNQDGIYSAVIIAITDKNLRINESYSVVIDDVDPSVTITNLDFYEELTPKSGRVTFNFEFSDAVSGIRDAVLDLGDGNSFDVTGSTSFTHTYIDLDQTYTVTLTIVDWAGNVGETSITLLLRSESTSQRNAPLLELYLLIIGLVLLVTSPLYGPRLIRELEKLREKF
jgi:hypothetical protein